MGFLWPRECGFDVRSSVLYSIWIQVTHVQTHCYATRGVVDGRRTCFSLKPPVCGRGSSRGFRRRGRESGVSGRGSGIWVSRWGRGWARGARHLGMGTGPGASARPSPPDGAASPGTGASRRGPVPWPGSRSGAACPWTRGRPGGRTGPGGRRGRPHRTAGSGAGRSSCPGVPGPSCSRPCSALAPGEKGGKRNINRYIQI